MLNKYGRIVQQIKVNRNLILNLNMIYQIRINLVLDGHYRIQNNNNKINIFTIKYKNIFLQINGNILIIMIVKILKIYKKNKSSKN